MEVDVIKAMLATIGRAADPDGTPISQAALILGVADELHEDVMREDEERRCREAAQAAGRRSA